MAAVNDANGDVLRRMFASGDDLSRPRNIEFTVVFPDQSAAERFAEHFRASGCKASVELTETAEDFPWDVVVGKYMAPSADEIAAFELMLQDVATPLSGPNDGWGCLSTNS